MPNLQEVGMLAFGKPKKSKSRSIDARYTSHACFVEDGKGLDSCTEVRCPSYACFVGEDTGLDGLGLSLRGLEGCRARDSRGHGL